MSNEVYANHMEVACKAAKGKSICAFPDVCFTPPQTPATPPGVPVPYPNTGFASDTTDGSRTVMISGEEVMLKNKSNFKRSTGDEAGCAPKKGIVTSKITGTVVFAAWSMDVRFEGENVPRHLDLTTHNHASEPPNPLPIAYVDDMSAAVQKACADQIKTAQGACANSSPSNCEPKCKEAQKCLLVPKGKDKAHCCSPHKTGHHMIEDHWVAGLKNKKYKYDDAPCVCANKRRTKGTVHRRLHDVQGTFEEAHMPGGTWATEPWDYAAGRHAAMTAHKEVFGDCGDDGKCIKAQLDSYYKKKLGFTEDTEIDLADRRQALGTRREPLHKKFIAQ